MPPKAGEPPPRAGESIFSMSKKQGVLYAIIAVLALALVLTGPSWYESRYSTQEQSPGQAELINVAMQGNGRLPAVNVVGGGDCCFSIL